jgi:choline-sulfatase
MRKRLLIPCAALALSCAHASADPPSAPAPERSALSPEAPAIESARARIRFALARHFERAEIRYLGTQILDLGSPAGSQHTAGGWMSNVGPDREIDGASAAISIGPRAMLTFQAEGRAAPISVRVRSFRAGTAQLYLDDREIASSELAANTWSEIRAELSADHLAPGEHELMVRFERSGTIEGAPRAFLAIDRVLIGGEPPPEGAPIAEEIEGMPALGVPRGFWVGYSMEVPEGARLRGVLERGGAIEVWAHADGREPARLESIGANDRAQPLDVDLSAYANEVARIELRAVRATRLRHPAIVTLDRTEEVSAPRPRNVIIYLIDTLRADRLSVYEPETRVRTPGISRFARDAALLTNARAAECWTKPSVATLLSSLLPWEHTAFADASAVPSSVRLLPEMLRDRGFSTAAFVANGYVSERFGFQRGWDRWRNYIREERSSRGDHVANDVVRWLDDRPADRPFFLYVHAIDPHVPYRPPEDFVRMYDPEPYRGPVDFSRDGLLLENIKSGRLRLGERDRRRLEALYDGEVSFQDAQLASIMDALEHRGLDDDTLIAITADHGEEFWDHGSVGHGHSLHEELVHVPLIIRAPGLPAQRFESAVGLVDVVPTLLDALGEPIPEELSGRSLWPELRGAGGEAPRASVAGFMEYWRSAATGRYKLIARSRNRIALFDLDHDPREQNDLARERPIAAAYLRATLGLHLARSRSDAPAQTRRPRHRARDAQIDPEIRAQLEALGYVTSD